MHGHEWYYCMRNLENALEEFRSSQYVVIENFYCYGDAKKSTIFSDCRELNRKHDV